MYIPEHFKETSLDRIWALIEDNAFGMLITAPDGVPFVSHLPFLFDRDVGSKGKLLCHMARTNPQWQHSLTVLARDGYKYINPEEIALVTA